MTTHARVYRMLTRLYPRSFRAQYTPDLVQAFSDLEQEHGAMSTWARTWVDLAVTVPRYRMESLVRRHVSSSALMTLASVIGLAGFAGLVLGWIVALPLFTLAVLVAVSQRTVLGRSLAVAPDRRRTRLRVAGMLALVAAATAGSWVYHLDRYDELGDTTVLAHNLVGIFALVGALIFGLAGSLQGPHRRQRDPINRPYGAGHADYSSGKVGHL